MTDTNIDSKPVMQQPEQQTEAVQVQASKAPIAFGSSGIQLKSFDDLWRFSTAVLRSGLAPKGMGSIEAIFVSIQMGAEVGLTPMASLQNIAPINGRPSIWGDAQLGVVRATAQLEKFEEWFEEGTRIKGNPVKYNDDTQAVCLVKRRGYPEVVSSFSVNDAKRAGLWGKEGPWKNYPFRMLKFRARGYALRDQFGDALKGLRTTEEMMDEGSIPIQAEVVQPSIPEPAAQPERATPKRRTREQVEQPPAEVKPIAMDPMKELQSLMTQHGVTEAELKACLVSHNMMSEDEDLPAIPDRRMKGIIDDFQQVAGTIKLKRRQATAQDSHPTLLAV